MARAFQRARQKCCAWLSSFSRHRPPAGAPGRPSAQSNFLINTHTQRINRFTHPTTVPEADLKSLASEKVLIATTACCSRSSPLRLAGRHHPLTLLLFSLNDHQRQGLPHCRLVLVLVFELILSLIYSALELLVWWIRVRRCLTCQLANHHDLASSILPSTIAHH